MQGVGRLCLLRSAHPSPSPGPHTHFLGILVGFPQSHLRLAFILPPIPFQRRVSWPLVHPGCAKSHIFQIWIPLANQWPGPRELSLVSQVMGWGLARKCS